MTKKDFVAIAKVIEEVRSLAISQNKEGMRAGIDIVALRLSEVCAKGNTHFDSRRFLWACGIEDPRAFTSACLSLNKAVAWGLVE